MKSTKILKSLSTVVLTVFLLGFMSNDIMAQRGMGKMHRYGMKDAQKGMCMNLPDLSEEQMEKIEKIKTDFMKENLPLKNEMDIKRAELKALSTGDEADPGAINKKIDEIAALQAKMMKKHAAHRQDIRKLLNDEQKLMFDQHGKRFGMGMGMDRDRPAPGSRGFRGSHPGCPYRDIDKDDED
ncbi:MAG: Spy/CpxP family protein refolding chaperone [Bacteroidota bacterium]|nr:Spy/CpxP family protein refolding chaperone [Bacteroidota bacterium]